MARIFWFRRDLRLQDHPALNDAIAGAKTDGDAKVFAVVSPMDYEDATDFSPIRCESLYVSWRSLDQSLKGALTVLEEPVAGIIELAKRHGVSSVHVSAAYDTKSVEYMKSARKLLEAAGLKLVVGLSNYAVAPGTVRKPDGTPYRVYTPFYKAWDAIGWSLPFVLEPGAIFERDAALHVGLESPEYPKKFAGKDSDFDSLSKLKAGEDFALRTFARFRGRGAHLDYQENRNRADLSGTSNLGHALSHGEIHPRTLLAELGDSAGEVTFAKELAWREFYADVLWHNPTSLTEYLEPRFAKMRYDDRTEIGEQRLAAWRAGLTGYPMVDAGMRQLLTEGWVHNRLRMIVASFLVKDLHIEWQRGAEWFETWLTDFDPASNAHGWQWTAGCGTDASPYYRVFNPVLQGLKFDPNGDFVRKYIPELRHIEGPAVHEPWLLIDGQTHGYPSPIVNHSEERDESLARLEELKAYK
jgi:deoxyribodipyrimidine photo-lyase